MKASKSLLLLLSILISLVIFGSCGEDPPSPPPEVTHYTVTFDYGTETKTLKVDVGDTIPTPKPQKRDGYEFIGWYSGDSKWNFDTPPTSDMTLLAKWDPITYRISYDLAGGSAEGNPTAYNASFDDVLLKAPTKKGYGFVGWIVNGTGAPVSQYTIKSGTFGSLSFFAVWQKCEHPEQKLSGDICAGCGADTVVYYEEFGAVGDGVTDDFEALKNTHAYANANASTVRGRSGAVYYIGEKSCGNSIVIGTDVVWNGITIIIDDSLILPNGNHSKPVFDVSASYTAVDFKSSAKAPIKAGSNNVGFAPGRAMLIYLLDSTAPKKYIRYGMNANSGSQQEEVILVDALGNVDPSTPVEWDYNTLTKITGYPVDEAPITIDGGGTTVIKTIANTAPNKYTYYSRTFKVTRSNTTVKGLYHEFDETGSETRAPYDGFVKMYMAHNVKVEGCYLTEHSHRLLEGTTNNSMGSYEIAANLSNKISWINCTQTNFYDSDGYVKGGGIMGTNGCRNMLFDGCLLSSFDAHTAAYNVTLKNSTCEHLNFIGAGDILLENMTVYSDIKEAALVLRNDYGSTWNGTVTINNMTLKTRNTTPEIDLIKAQYARHDFGMKTYLPHTVRVTGLSVKKYDVTFSPEGERIETLSSVATARVYIYRYLRGFKSDISSPDGGNVNPYSPTKSLYINDSPDITWIYPQSPQFKNMKVYVDGQVLDWRDDQ